MKHKHQWVPVYGEKEGTRRKDVSGLWIKISRKMYVAHNAQACIVCGIIRLKDIDKTKELLDAKNIKR